MSGVRGACIEVWWMHWAREEVRHAQAVDYFTRQQRRVATDYDPSQLRGPRLLKSLPSEPPISVDNSKCCGGGSGIRTRDRVSPMHAFQACAFNRSATPPVAPALEPWA